MGTGKKFGVGIEETILVLLIYLNVIDFLEVIPPDLDYAKKIISWVGLGILLYKVSPTKIFFGRKHKWYDIALILSYFCFITKNMISYAKVALELSKGPLRNLYELILANSNFFEISLINVGFISLIILALIMTFKLEIFSPSTLYIIHEHGKPTKNVLKQTFRFLSILLVVFGFFYIVFNLIMEWLAIAVDAPLLMVGLASYFIVAFRYRHVLKTTNLIYKLGNMGEEFYEKFVNLFQSEKIYLGITGLLVLHLLTDVGNFMLPYLFSIHDDLYFGQFLQPHQPIISLLSTEITATANPGTLVLAYFANIFTTLSFLIIPAFIWNNISKKQNINFNKVFLIIFYACISVFIFAPLFKFQRLGNESLRGIDIITQKILVNSSYTIESTLIVTAIVGIIFAILTLTKFKPLIDIFTFFISTGFFGYYIFLYFSDIFFYYLENIPYLFSISATIPGIFTILALGYGMIFYVGGFFIYIFSVLTN
ncbi:hypothetical protein JXM83_00715 [Candidatus Woesearchaeota archaeon]|nr:hypothetical protein [Candidatus Woesearchaeota archaeon]